MVLKRLSLWTMLVGMLGCLCLVAAAQQNVPLVTGKSITQPPLGNQHNVGSMPMNMILTPNGKYAISSNMGFRQALWAIDVNTGKGVSKIDIPRTGSGLYFGLAIKPNSDGSATLYAGQGGQSTVAVVQVSSEGQLKQVGTFELTKGDFVAGVALDGRGNLYVAINQFGTSGRIPNPAVITTPGSLVILNASNGKEISRLPLGKAPTSFPIAVVTTANGNKTFVSSQRDGLLYVVNTANPSNPKLETTVTTGSHPVAMTLNRNQSRLYVVNAHSDTVSVVETATNRILDTILVRPAGAGSVIGATPVNLTLSPDDKRLYVSLGDMNAIAVVDLAKRSVIGYVPTGWYPTGVVVTKNRLIFCNAKGTKTRNPNNKPVVMDADLGTYILNIIEGNVSTLPLPNGKALANFSMQVAENNRYANPVPVPDVLKNISIASGKIKHVIYIIKENRTYDQVLGDLKDVNGRPFGNGDPSLCLYGKNVTPNQHALTQRFVTLDNFYVCGEASGDGWPWSTQGMANEYVIKNLPYNYSGRGRNYDFEGQNNGYPTGGVPEKDPDGKPLVSPGTPLSPSAPPIQDVAEAPGKHIWDSVLKAGLTLRNYGIHYSFGAKSGDKVLIPENFPTSSGLLPAGRDLEGISNYDFRRYDGTYADSDATHTWFERLKAQGDPKAEDVLYPMRTYGKYNSVSRFSEWNREFQMMLKKDPSGKAVPNFMMVRFMNDHTRGVTAGVHTPEAQVADNDYAVGQLVEAVSKSPIWKHTAIFILEDDAQNGQDHVDAHRSICFVISPYIKAQQLDSTFYNTNSVLRTIEILLGLPPLNQYNAVATPILGWDSEPNNAAPYAAILPEKEIVCAKAKANGATDALAKLTAKLNFDLPDSADPELLNAILWKHAYGLKAVPPKPRYAMKLPEPRKRTLPKTTTKTN